MVLFSRAGSSRPFPPRSPRRAVSVCITFLLAAGALGLLNMPPAVAAEAKQPNVVFILADDLGWRDLSGEGSRFYESPHLDRLADSGMRFSQGYATCQVCSPSRASIMTGKFPARHGVTDWIGAKTGFDWNRNDKLLPAEYEHRLAADELTLAEVMREAGYRTFFAGKWHLGNEGSFPEDHGFEFNVGGHHRGSPPGGFFAPFRNPKMEDGPPGESLPLRLSRETASFIETHQQEPFFAFLSFYSVHAPIQTHPDLWKKYQVKASEHLHRGDRFLFDRTLPVRQVQDCPIYAGMIEAMDDGVGIVLETLERLGLDDNTIVIFTSDNGGVSSGDAYATANRPLRGGKGRQWEGGIREPFLIRAPGITPPESENATPVTGADFYPTLLELTGLPPRPEQHVDGVSLVPLLQGKAIADRPLFWHYPHYGNQGGEPSSIIRRGDWKLIHYWEDGRDELYDLVADPGEQRDRVANHPDRAEALRRELDAWLQETDAKIPQPDPRFDPVKKQQQLHSRRTALKERLEKQHARFLEPDFQPNPSWWGSLATED